METIDTKINIPPSPKKHALMRILDDLSEDQIERVISFALIVKGRTKELKSVPPDHLASLSGLVLWGGNAVEDSEKLYG